MTAVLSSRSALTTCLPGGVCAGLAGVCTGLVGVCAPPRAARHRAESPAGEGLLQLEDVAEMHARGADDEAKHRATIRNMWRVLLDGVSQTFAAVRKVLQELIQPSTMRPGAREEQQALALCLLRVLLQELALPADQLGPLLYPPAIRTAALQPPSPKRRRRCTVGYAP